MFRWYFLGAVVLWVLHLVFFICSLAKNGIDQFALPHPPKIPKLDLARPCKKPVSLGGRGVG